MNMTDENILSIFPIKKPMLWLQFWTSSLNTRPIISFCHCQNSQWQNNCSFEHFHWTFFHPSVTARILSDKINCNFSPVEEWLMKVLHAGPCCRWCYSSRLSCLLYLKYLKKKAMDYRERKVMPINLIYIKWTSSKAQGTIYSVNKIGNFFKKTAT